MLEGCYHECWGNFLGAMSGEGVGWNSSVSVASYFAQKSLAKGCALVRLSMSTCLARIAGVPGKASASKPKASSQVAWLRGSGAGWRRRRREVRCCRVRVGRARGLRDHFLARARWACKKCKSFSVGGCAYRFTRLPVSAHSQVQLFQFPVCTVRETKTPYAYATANRLNRR